MAHPEDIDPSTGQPTAEAVSLRKAIVKFLDVGGWMEAKAHMRDNDLDVEETAAAATQPGTGEVEDEARPGADQDADEQSFEATVQGEASAQSSAGEAEADQPGSADVA